MNAFVTLVLVLSMIPVIAHSRDRFTNYLDGYIVQAEKLDAPDCAGPAFDVVELGALKTFEQGLCVYHRDARSPEDTRKSISLLDEAQLRGLPPVQQNFAALLTGLAQCSEAKRHLDTFRASGNQNRLSRTMFCRDRRFSLSELSSIRWNHALFDYAEGLGGNRSVDARLSEMNSCYAGVLDASFDAECGLISNISETEIEAFVDDAVDEVIIKYFSGVESPITAMFSRKLERTEGLRKSAEQGISNLEQDAELVNKSHQKLNEAYEAARDTKMGPIYDSYREAILRATAILDEFDRWKGGLFINSEGVNLLPKISERSVEIEEELVRANELAFDQTTSGLVADIQRITNAEIEERKTIASLCRIYFCELTARRSLSNTIRACRRPSLENNPLCIAQNGQLKSGILTVDFNGVSTADVTGFCQSAGLDPAFTTVNMPPASARTCTAQLP